MPLITTDAALGAVFLEGPLGLGPPHAASVVVGDPPQWSDGSPSTYATTHHGDSGDYRGSDFALAPFPAVVSSEALVRSIDVTATITGQGQSGIATVGLEGYPLAGAAELFDFDIPGDTIARVYTATLGLEYGAPPLVTGGVAMFFFGVPGNVFNVYGATCYELTITVTYWGGQPPRRIFPRDDGLTGGAPRNYPPSKGVQSGNRAAGGYV